MKIRNINLIRTQLPLKKPYILSFATLEHFVSLQIQITLEDGRSNSAEVVPLFGYSEEREETIAAYLETKAKTLQGLTLAEARQIAARDIPQKPFSTSPLLTAIDLFDWTWQTPEDAPHPSFVLPISVKERDAFADTLARCIDEQRTLKLKLSGQPEADIAAVEKLETIPAAAHVTMRLDANQAYTLAGAKQLFQKLNNSSLSAQFTYVEQPLPVEAWDQVSQLIRAFPQVAIMLDESIVTLQDLERASQLGVPFIKLKLFKQGGLRETLALAQAAADKHIQTILGNGVATDISNRLEIRLHQDYPQLFFGDSEANGFLKIAPDRPSTPGQA